MNKTFSIFYLKSENKFLVCRKPVQSFIYYRDFRINLLTGERESFPISEFLKILQAIKVGDHFTQPYVCHLFYEFGYQVQGLEELIPANTILAITAEYGQVKVMQELPFNGSEEVAVELKDYPRFKNYKQRFEKIYKHLIDGDCYQVNLTSQFYFRFKEQIGYQDLICSLWKDRQKIGHLAHCTYLDSMDKLLISNTPECLFRLRKNKQQLRVSSMPIKGTIKCEKDSEIQKKWKELSGSCKEQAELYMITDLIRNDLARIESAPAVVLKKKLPLRVPGILHQYSLVEAPVNPKVSLLDLVKGMYPGGSITGAPKKRVMGIINQVEDNYRSFYCGSTVLFHKSLKAASINIRSAEVDLSTQEMMYGAGGGLTLESKPSAEFQESFIKMESFLRLMGSVP